MRRNRKRTPWARRRRKAILLVLLLVTLVFPWLIWRLGVRADYRDARNAIREAGVPVTEEARLAWLAKFPQGETTALFSEAASAYVPLPFELLDQLPSFRTRQGEDHLYERPYPEERVAAAREALRINAESLEILLRAGDLPAGVDAVEQYPSEELVELLCMKAYVAAADGDGAAAAESVLCGLHLLECTAAPYAGPALWSKELLEKLLHALFGAASQTVLPGESLLAIREKLDPAGWEEQYRGLRIDTTSRWLIDSEQFGQEKVVVVHNIIFGMLDRYFQREMEVVTKGYLPATGLTKAEQEAMLAAYGDEDWIRWMRPVRHPERLNLARLAIDIIRYDQEHGALPTDLDALVPRYYKATPHDAFSGLAYVYTRNGQHFTVGAPEEESEEPTAWRPEGVAFQVNLPPR